MLTTLSLDSPLSQWASLPAWFSMIAYLGLSTWTRHTVQIGPLRFCSWSFKEATHILYRGAHCHRSVLFLRPESGGSE